MPQARAQSTLPLGFASVAITEAGKTDVSGGVVADVNIAETMPTCQHHGKAQEGLELVSTPRGADFWRIRAAQLL